MSIDVPVQPAAPRERATTSVRGIVSRDLERELAEWTCANQEAIGDAPVILDESVLGDLALRE